MAFYDDKLFLQGESAQRIYDEIKDLPVVDYHCHLDQTKIKADATFSDIGEMWLAGDHYKWRAMRICGVDEKYITGDATFKEKFFKYASIMPKLAGNALYYWTHLELKQIFGIDLPLNSDTAQEIYERANEKIKNISVRSLLKLYGVKYIATTDDPVDTLDSHGVYDGIEVRPTFRPDKALSLDNEYLKKLEEVSGQKIKTTGDVLRALENRLQFFVKNGCKISDHGFKDFPDVIVDESTADEYFARRESLSEVEKTRLLGYFLVNLAKIYRKYSIIMQLHFSVTRNVNPAMKVRCGVDSGFDVIASAQKIENVIAFFSAVSDDQRPETILYTLNDCDLPSLCCITGAYAHVKSGAAWWFNDTVEGIRNNLKKVSEYSVLGTNYGMLTDSRSFASYARFDFFRRILSGYLGELVDKGEYDESAAIQTAKDVSYYNIKNTLNI
ncbi:MAG: glucuronate isomerase [Clostridia bacterium]|nr:glucuronate isomerase [Clostridia bacterium]MBR6773037.1 glucuronate isomerase [Clostridia bacterium]